jgi:hypothetical protein
MLVTAVLAASSVFVLPTTAASADASPIVRSLASTLLPSQVDVTPSPTGTEFPTRPIPPVLEPPLVSILKESFPVSFNVVLDVNDLVDLDELARDLDGVMEEYLLEELSKLENLSVDLNIRDVSLQVTLLASARARRRQMLRFLQTTTQQQQQQQGIAVAVEGAVRYDTNIRSCLECVDQAIGAELESLLAVDNLNRAILESELEGVLGVSDSQIIENRDELNGVQNPLDVRINGSDTTPEGNEDGLERPSTLSITFGFILTGIGVLSLILYVYIFYRKRQKKLRKEKQRLETVQYPVPSSKGSTNSSNKRPLKTSLKATSVTTPDKDESSDGSSYKGIDSISDEGPADSFANELQEAASLDEQAWDDFQRKKGNLDQGINATEAASRGRHGGDSSQSQSNEGQYAKSFPYGDEQEVGEDDVDWTNDSEGSSWEPYNSSMKTEEKKDDQEPASRDSSAVLQSIEQTLSEYGNNSDPDADEDIEPSDAVMEVERLARFVKKLEKRKERRIQRESNRMNRSADVYGSNTSGINISANNTSNSSDPVGVRGSIFQRSAPQEPSANTSYLSNMRSASRRAADKPRHNQEQAPRIPTFTGILPTGELYNQEIMSVSDNDDYSEDSQSEDDHQREDGHERLGITPFSVQKPEERGGSSDDLSPTMQKLARDEAMRTGARDDNFSMPADEHVFDRRRAQSGGESYNSRPHRLSDLRSTNAIIDSSQSDVNVGFSNSNSSGSPERQSRIPASRAPKLASSPNPGFNKLFSLFEGRPNNAVFPADEHWQNGGVTK